MTSQYEEFSRNDTGWSGIALQSANAKYEHKLARLDLPTPCDMRAPGAATGVYALECAMDELAVALKLDPLELRLRCYSDRDQNAGSSLHQQEAARMLPPGRGSIRLVQAELRAPLDARRQRTGRLGHGDRRLGSAADADGRPHRADRQRHAEVVLRHLRYRHRYLHDHGAGGGRHARSADRQRHGQARRSTLPHAPVEGGSWTAASVVARHCNHGRRGAQGAAAPGARRCRARRLPAATPDDVVLADGKIVGKEGRQPRAVSIADAMRHGGVDRIEHEKISRIRRGHTSTPVTRTRRSSPR